MASFSETLADTLQGTQAQIEALEAEVAHWRDLRVHEALETLSTSESREILLHFAASASSPAAMMQLVNALRRLDHAA